MTQEPLTPHEIALAQAHFIRTASPEQITKLNMVNPETGLKLGDDPQVIRAWLARARSPEGLVTALYGANRTIDEETEISRARRLSDTLMRKRSQPNTQQHFQPGDTSKAAILATFYPASRP